MILIGIGIVGILLIGTGIYLYMRDRSRLLKEEQEEQRVLQVQQGQIEEDALGDDSDDLMDAMIALDDQYKAGEIPREAYEKRRNELKERLKVILAP
jgi:type II secretory pathway pseudopilin PulG